MKLRIHPDSKQQLDNISTALPHALLLAGERGIGLYTIADDFALRNGVVMAIVRPEALRTSSTPQIAVNTIRQLYEQAAVAYDSPHFIIIDDADAMNQSAQNALLKLLEEPNPSIHFVLTTHFPDKLLPTIRSRLQTLTIAPISELETNRLLKELGVTDETDKKRLLYIAAGLPAEISRLTKDPSALRAVVERAVLARRFVEGTVYDRLVIINSFKDDRNGALDFIALVMLILRKSIGQSSSSNSLILINKLMDASSAIRQNGNVRLQLSSAVV